MIKCKICGAEIPISSKADGQDDCCDKIACQDDFADWIDNTVSGSER